MTSSLRALCQGMPVILEHLDRQSIVNLPLVCKETNDAVRGFSDVYWAKNDIAIHLARGKMTPAGIPCSIQRYISSSIGLYTLSYIPVKYGTSPGNLLKSYMDFLNKIKHLEMCVFILVRSEHFLEYPKDELCGGICIKYQCIYRSRAWHREYAIRVCTFLLLSPDITKSMTLPRQERITRVDRVRGLRQLLTRYPNMSESSDLTSKKESPIIIGGIVYPVMTVRAEAELAKNYDNMDGRPLDD